MGKLKRRSVITPRCYILFAITAVALLTLMYEIAVFCALDRISSATYIDGSYTADTYKSDEVGNIHADKVLHEFAGFRESNVKDLDDTKIVNTVHYVWCSDETFEFRHYLSVLSIWKILQPDIIELHYQELPGTDKYNDWLMEINKTVPAFVAKPIPPNWDGDDKGCGFWFGMAIIDDRGGIYIGNDVIITEDVVKFMKKDMAIFFREQSSSNQSDIVVAMGIDHRPEYRQLRKNFHKRHEILKESFLCQSLTYPIKATANASGPCFTLGHSFHPVDILTIDTNFGAFARKLVYGKKDIIKPKPVLPGTIPKIVHYVWFGTKELNFMMYLSMLSTLFIANAQKVFIYWDGHLHGNYLDRILKDKRVTLVLREKPFYIYGNNVLYTQHRSDIVRAECLLKYGGIYMDWDVLWLRNPDDVLNTGYDAIANFDHMPQTGFPDTINLGVLMSKPKSTFIKRWQDALINYKSKDFLYNAIELPYKIYEKYPEYLFIERRLQVMCFRLKCHPAFHEDFKLFMNEQPFDWRTDVYSIHFTHPDPDEFNSESTCRNGTGRFADMCRFIFDHHHKLD